MEYTKYLGEKFSYRFGRNVTILQYESKDPYPYCDCDYCGKPLAKKMFVLQDPETDIVLMTVGSDCLKKLAWRRKPSMPTVNQLKED